MLLLGVDSGGTKTQFILTTEAGEIIASRRLGSGSFFATGGAGVTALVAEGARAVCGEAGVPVADIACAGLGFPGYGEKAGSEAEILQACQAALPSARIACACDCALGWAGSLAMEPGVNIIAGTGSNCYGVNAAGESARSSGWGACCDEGSCNWIGRRLIQTYAKQADGRLPRTALYERFRAHFGIEDDTQFIHPLNHDVMRDGAGVAKLQLLVRGLYDEGEPFARAVYTEAAEELALSIHAVAAKLRLGEGYRASYSGGLFQNGEIITKPLAEAVARRGGALQAPRYTPEQGAVLLAMRALDPERSFDDLHFTIKGGN